MEYFRNQSHWLGATASPTYPFQNTYHAHRYHTYIPIGSLNLLPPHMGTVCNGVHRHTNPTFSFYPNITSRSPYDATHITTQQWWFWDNTSTIIHQCTTTILGTWYPFKLQTTSWSHALWCQHCLYILSVYIDSDVKDKVPQTVHARLPSATHTDKTQSLFCSEPGTPDFAKQCSGFLWPFCFLCHFPQGSVTLWNLVKTTQSACKAYILTCFLYTLFL